ncbi:MAG: class I SAM-dependent methyltransferase [Candidatus Thiodiazotropha sp. (ex Myrtea spinifera)]|nr:class I SAM-dependent methyltransferase [Candidatus Thiodiazotropha sp. (ex Myrtea spinifera)]
MPNESLKSKWDTRHGDAEKRPKAAEVLTQNLHLLPHRGQALDLACGLGGNALAMAARGMHVTAWDLSSVDIERLQKFNEAQGHSNLNATMRDVEKEPPLPNSFDVIVISYYLDRQLIPHLIAALKPGGLIFYQTFTQIAVSDEGPTNPEYRLGDNELLALFSDLKLRFYREENRLGDLAVGMRDVAMLVAERVT